jgi:hypothetical protein
LVDIKNTYLAIIAIVALAITAALPIAVQQQAVQQQAFAQETDDSGTSDCDDGLLQSSTDTDNKVKQKCNISGIGNDCHQADKSRLGVE